METVSVTLDLRALIVNGVLIAGLPALALLVVAFFFSAGQGRALAVFALVVFCGLLAFVLFQGGYGRLIVDGERLAVRAGFYGASWPLSDLEWVEDTQSLLNGSVRVNGVAMYGYRAGWFRKGNQRIFLLATSADPVCFIVDGTALCLDRGAAASLPSLFDGKWH
ncbi:hypothetical protein ECTPHS_10486 [Ectothiorhodospira sp. PHS-1]|uniref:hypothetical protein n=1 Tax=Ectothiorhodospira sp. PHS-1 TaxID=519989 RepID=UPI00024A8B41|nr:hypothetical protein [Ectothiorhodospira sp. PHS-1]EHQ53108.1 hypothetical protein ECTPHS_10486 [Ectothiorhodospira sp. PHS-1]